MANNRRRRSNLLPRAFLSAFLGASSLGMGAPLAAQVAESDASKQAAALATAAEAADAAEPMALWTSGRYRLTPSDVLELHFPYVAEFDQTVMIQPDGYISLKVIGDVRVQGRTLPEVRALISESYVEVLREPLVNIVLKEFEKPYFLVAGEVVNPGRYELRGATTLTQALVQAGGNKWSAKHSQVLLFRRFNSEWLEAKEFDVKKMYASGSLAEDPLLRPGDTILVPKSVVAKIAPLIPRPVLGFNPF
jgi:polysaccharide export outer membrane protein